MKSTPLVSIIIPVKGRFELVKNAISSVYSQQNFYISDVEIIMVEERNYGENVRSKIKKLFPKVITLQNQNKEGPGGSRNTGLTRACGKYIVFLDSDDRMEPKYLYEMTRTLENDKKCSACVCLSKSSFDKHYNLLERIKLYPLMLIRDVILFSGYLLNNYLLYPSSFYLCQISHMMFKATAIKDLRFNYDYRRGGEDWDFFVSIQKYGPIRIVPKILLNFGYYPGSSTDSPINRWRKWESYSLLASRLPEYLKQSLFYKLFLLYIRIFH